MGQHIKNKHRELLLDHFELACMFGAFICGVDLLWLLHDITTNGVHVLYVVVGIGLLSGLVGTLYCARSHHIEALREYRRILLEAKLKAVSKHLNKHPKVTAGKKKGGAS